MDNIFKDKTSEGFDGERDVLGGGGTVETDIYDGIIKLAFSKKSASSDAQGVEYHIELTMPSGSTFTFRETQWVTNRSGEHTYPDKTDPKKKHLLPGYQIIDSLCLMSTGLPLSDQEMAEKTVNLYDFEQKKELPKSVPVLIDLIGKPIAVAVIKQTVDQTTKDSNNVYQPNGKTRDQNVAFKFFHQESKRTTAEVKAGIEKPIFYDKWKTQNQGKSRNLAKGAEGNTGAPTSKSSAAPDSKPRTSLFNS